MLDAEHDNHRRHLQTIYKERENIKLKATKTHSDRILELEHYHKVKVQTHNRKSKLVQDKINY